MLFTFINKNANTSWLLCFNMPLGPRGTAKHFAKASGKENFASNARPPRRRCQAAHVGHAPTCIAPRAGQGWALQGHPGVLQLGSSILCTASLR